MGLLKAGVGALGGVLADQWREYFYCESLDDDILAAKGEKRTGGRSSNKRGEDNIISNGSIIAVNEGQCVIIVEQGKVVDVCAEPGEFVYDSSTEPSIFYGKLGEQIKNTFGTIGKRFTFGGDAAKDQRVYYFNTKEILGNRFGTATPIPFRVVVDEALGFVLSVDLRCNGEYSYKIVDPLRFYTAISANVADVYERSQIDSMLKSELLNALQPAFGKLAANRIQYYEIPMHTEELSDALNEALSNKWRERRGLQVCSMNINSVSVPDEQRKKITEWEETAMSTNERTAAAHLTTAQAQAMKDAANNQGGMGAMGGFVGMNMAQGAASNVTDMFEMARHNEQQSQHLQKPQQEGWICECGASNTGKFCRNCGKPKPGDNSWVCSCGTSNAGKFCQNCGKPRPSGFKCDKCGWVPEDPSNPPKFCPECGDSFDENDKM